MSDDDRYECAEDRPGRIAAKDIERLESLKARVRELEAENARLRVLLTPFAAQARDWWTPAQKEMRDGIRFHFCGEQCRITVGDCRKAREALEG